MAAKPLSRRGQFTIGILVVALGLCVAALAASYVGKPTGRFDPVVGFIAGFAFAFAGAILVVPERQERTRAWFGALMITCIALLFDWLAFGPGERQDTTALGNASAARVHFWQVPGRLLLVSGAVLFNLMALWAWIRARRVRRKTARA
jgi:uncharacterized membrane protein